MKSTEDRLLYLLKSRGPQTAGEAGEALGITGAAAQQHVARLSKQGLVRPEDRRHGRGRPRRHWHLTAAGHARFPDRHADLTLDVLTATRQLFGEDGLNRLIAHREATTLAAYRTELATCDTIADRIAGLARIRTREGYMADWEERRPGEFLLVENHCPVCAAAAACQGLCRSELALFRALLGAGVRVERTDHVLAGARRCAYVIVCL